MKAACGAKTRSGAPCKRAPMANGRCKLHGGASLRGAAAPAFKSGRYSKYLPARLAERYQAAQTDTDLLALREEVGLTDARLADVLTRVDMGESGALWKTASQTFNELLTAQAMGDQVRERFAKSSLKKLFEQGLQDWVAWEEIAKLVEQRRKLVESEGKRLVAMQQNITAERAMAMIGRLAGIIQRHVTDPTIISAISADIGALLTVEASVPTDADG